LVDDYIFLGMIELLQTFAYRKCIRAVIAKAWYERAIHARKSLVEELWELCANNAISCVLPDFMYNCHQFADSAVLSASRYSMKSK
jgi:hypothetical protein